MVISQTKDTCRTFNLMRDIIPLLTERNWAVALQKKGKWSALVGC